MSQPFHPTEPAAGRPCRGEAPVENGPVPGRATPTAPPDASADANPGDLPNADGVLHEDAGQLDDADHPLPDRPRLQQMPKGRRLAKKSDEPVNPLTPEQRREIPGGKAATLPGVQDEEPLFRRQRVDWLVRFLGQAA